MTRTGVFATDSEVEELRSVMQTPVMMIFEPRRDPLVECHRMALCHGLPEIPGYYGIDGNEFVTI